MTTALLFSSSAQKLDICPFPKEVAGGEAGACAAADYHELCFQLLPDDYMFLVGVAMQAISLSSQKIFSLDAVSGVSDAGR